MNNKIKQDIYEFLKVHGVMTLATCEDNMPWVSTLYYGIDEEMNMYIVTDPNNVHGIQIVRNPQVAFNIFDSHQKITEPKKGVQGKGTIKMLKGLKWLTKRCHSISTMVLLALAPHITGY